MGKITINELHKSLYNYAQAVSDENLMTESKTVVNAINEIYGKQLIANAIGEPLNDTDTFTKMNDDINGLLSTFKTNMMNNGVTVETGDKFKSLIDKIATMVEEGSGKGIQYITNTVDWSVTRNDIYAEGIDVIVDDLTFKPSFVLVELTDEGGKKLIYSEYHYNTDTDIMLYAGTNDYGSYKQIYGFIEITDNGFNIHHTASSNPISYTFSITYHIIGVGEKDTTLSGGLNIISAIQLPSEVVNNQIVLISNIDPTAVEIKDNSLCNPSVEGMVNVGTTSTNNGKYCTIAKDNITVLLYLIRALQYVNGSVKQLSAYVGIDGSWVQFSWAGLYAFISGAYENSNLFGTFTNAATSSTLYSAYPPEISGNNVKIGQTSSSSSYDESGYYKGNALYYFTTKINCTNYSKLKITVSNYSKTNVSTGYIHFGIKQANNTYFNSSTDKYIEITKTGTYEVDLSSYNSTGYIAAYIFSNSYSSTKNCSAYVYISSIELMP